MFTRNTTSWCDRVRASRTSRLSFRRTRRCRRGLLEACPLVPSSRYQHLVLCVAEALPSLHAWVWSTHFRPRPPQARFTGPPRLFAHHRARHGIGRCLFNACSGAARDLLRTFDRGIASLAQQLVLLLGLRHDHAKSRAERGSRGANRQRATSPIIRSRLWRPGEPSPERSRTSDATP